MSHWCGVASAGMVFLMVVLGVWNVIGRYLGKIIGQNLSSNGLIELQWYLFDIVFFMGAAYALKNNSHVRVDVFYKDFSPKLKALINILGVVLFLFPFCGVIIYFSWQYVLSSWQTGEVSADEGGLPRYPIKTLIIVGPALLILQGFSELIKNIAIFLSTMEETQC